MEFLNIIGSISIKPDWANITGAVLKAGTPISATGTVANNAAAIGLLAQDAHKGDSEVNVVYAGLVDMNEVKRSYGTLYDNCIAALKGITFINASGSAIVPSGLPSVSASDNGKVLTVANGAWIAQQPSGGGALVVTFGGSAGLTPDKTNAEIAAAASAGQLVVFKWSRDDGIFFGIAYIALQSGTMTYAQASATNNMYDGMLSTMTYDGVWSSTEKYLG